MSKLIHFQAQNLGTLDNKQGLGSGAPHLKILLEGSAQLFQVLLINLRIIIRLLGHHSARLTPNAICEVGTHPKFVPAHRISL